MNILIDGETTILVKSLSNGEYKIKLKNLTSHNRLTTKYYVAIDGETVQQAKDEYTRNTLLKKRQALCAEIQKIDLALNEATA